MVYGLGFLAGVFSTLSPCVLPLLPIIMGSALQQDRLAPLALTAGFTLSFALLGGLLAGAGFMFGIDPNVFRYAAAALMAVFGLILLVPVFYSRFAMAAGSLTGGANRLAGEMDVTSRASFFGLGALLGVVWTPCTGPTLGAAVAMASQSESAMNAMVIMGIFAIGAALPLLALSYGSRQAIIGRRQQLAKLAEYGKPILGAVLVIIAILILSGLDKALETTLTQLMPEWMFDITTRF